MLYLSCAEFVSASFALYEAAASSYSAFAELEGLSLGEGTVAMLGDWLGRYSTSVIGVVWGSWW